MAKVKVELDQIQLSVLVTSVASQISSLQGLLLFYEREEDPERQSDIDRVTSNIKELEELRDTLWDGFEKAR